MSLTQYEKGFEVLHGSWTACGLLVSLYRCSRRLWSGDTPEYVNRMQQEVFKVLGCRQDQRYLAEKDLFPCGDGDKSRFSPDFENPLSIMGWR